MKKILLAGLATGIVAFGMVGISNATVINFDTLSDGSALATHSTLTDQYSDLGVSFTGFEDGVEVDTFTDDYWGTSPAGGNYWSNGLPDNADDWGDERRDTLRVTFEESASNIGFDYWNSHGSLQITFNFYDSTNALLGTQSLNSNGWETVSFSYSGVSYFEMNQPRDDWFFSLDNLTFESEASDPVPEPATMLLFGTGLMGLVGIRRKKK